MAEEVRDVDVIRDEIRESYLDLEDEAYLLLELECADLNQLRQIRGRLDQFDAHVRRVSALPNVYIALEHPPFYLSSESFPLSSILKPSAPMR